MPESRRQPYILKDGVLYVYKDLSQDFDLSFDQACSNLLKCPETNLVIDISAISYINSTYIGMIAATYFQASDAGKKLQVRTNDEVYRVLKLAGLTDLIELLSNKKIEEKKEC